MEKHTIIFVAAFFLLVAFLPLNIVHAEQNKSVPLKTTQLKGEGIKNDIIDYLRQHNCETLDHESLAQQLGISQNTLFDCLMELEREKRIQSTMKNLRKPILITHGDKTNYFWKVCLVSEE